MKFYKLIKSDMSQSNILEESKKKLEESNKLYHKFEEQYNILQEQLNQLKSLNFKLLNSSLESEDPNLIHLAKEAYDLISKAHYDSMLNLYNVVIDSIYK